MASPPLHWFFKTFFGGPSFNALAPPVPRIHLRLRWLDPAGTVRDFPPNYPVRVRFGDGATSVVACPPVQPGGRVFFDARVVDPWQFFTLEFPAADVPYIVVEALGSPPMSPPQHHLAPGLTGAIPNNQRFFSLPRNWELKQADWSPPAFTGNGRFDSPPGRIVHTLSPPVDISIGTPANPVVFVLNPHWHFSRFEFYDRYFGNAHLDSPPRTAHRKRISIPPVAVEGFRADPNAAGVAPASPPDAHSNWTLDTGGGDLVQAWPLLLRRNPAGAELSPPTGSTLGLRFRTDPNTVVYSQTDARRVIAVSPPPAAPNADRLRYYDLPQIWKSRGYYTRRVASSPPAPGKFFQTLTSAEIAQAENRANPLVFCLDDMVLYTAAGAALNPLPPLGATDRVAIFGHRFTNQLANCGPQGLYNDNTSPTPIDVPFSNVPTANNYLFDYPDWTRLVVAQGSLYDVFDRRTPDSASPPVVVGARAAVRWVDAAGPLGINVGNAAGVNQGNVPIIPNRTRAPGPAASANIGLGGNFPARFDSAPPMFSVQPFYGQFRPDSRFQPYNPARMLQRGRFDIALLRCCDVEAASNTEVAVNLHYIKTFFNFLSPPPSPPGFAVRLNRNVMNRWSGNDGVNTSRTQLLAQLSPPGLTAPKTHVVWYCQSVPNPRAHCAVNVININRANRETIFGGGASGPTNDVPLGGGGFASAHECGHMDGLPDEYNERWSGTSYNEISVRQNLPGDPYEPDDGTLGSPPALGISSMMNSNDIPRNRHFWHAAEWVRQIVGTPLRVRIDNVDNDYTLPQFAQANSAYYPWPLLGPLNQSNPGNAFSRFDMYLHAMGKERYSVALLSGATAAAPFDGVLVIIVRVHCTLPPNATPATETANRQSMLASITAAVRNQLNNRWFAAGTANFGGGSRRFNKCLIEFRVAVVVTNHPFVAATQATATNIAATFPAHFNLQVISPPASPPANPWSPPARRLTLHTVNLLANLGPAFIAQFPTMLGIPSPPPPPPGVPFPAGAMDSAHIQPIVRLVIPDAVITRFR